MERRNKLDQTFVRQALLVSRISFVGLGLIGNKIMQSGKPYILIYD